MGSAANLSRVAKSPSMAARLTSSGVALASNVAAASRALFGRIAASSRIARLRSGADEAVLARVAPSFAAMASTSVRREPVVSHALAMLAAEAPSGEAMSLDRAVLIPTDQAGFGLARTAVARAARARERVAEVGASASAASRAAACAASALDLVTTASRSGRTASASFAASAARVLWTGLRMATADAADCANALSNVENRFVTASTAESGRGLRAARPVSASIRFRALPERTRSKRESARRAAFSVSAEMRIALLESALSVDAMALESCWADSAPVR